MFLTKMKRFIIYNINVINYRIYNIYTYITNSKEHIEATMHYT